MDDNGSSWERNKFATELSLKVSMAFVGLTFATLALSIQFSPNLGTEWKELLAVCWGLLLISGLAGGYNSLYTPVAFKRMLSGHNNALDTLNSRFLWFGRAQRLSFVGGVVSNLAFAIKNYLV